MSDLSELVASLAPFDDRWFVLSEDLARAVVGPFDDQADATDWATRDALDSPGVANSPVPARVLRWLDPAAVSMVLAPEDAPSQAV